MTNLDDLRRLSDEDPEPAGITVDFEELIANQRPRTKPRPFLGLSAGQRAFLSLVIFLNVLILGAGLLFVTGRLGF